MELTEFEKIVLETKYHARLDELYKLLKTLNTQVCPDVSEETWHKIERLTLRLEKLGLKPYKPASDTLAPKYSRFTFV